MNKNRSNKMPEILIIDDSVENLKFLSKELKNLGYVVRAAKGGYAGILSAETEPPDLILLDVEMPDLNGYEVCRRLKSNEIFRSIPVLFISSHVEILNKVKGFDAGGVDYIVKPLEVKEVQARIETHLSIKTLQNKLEDANLRLEEKVEFRTEELQRSYAQLEKINAENLEAKRKFEESEKKYKSIVESSLDGYLFVNEDFSIVDFNKGFSDLVGYHYEELLGWDYKNLIYSKEKDWDSLLFGFRENGNNKKLFQFELIDKEGNLIPVEASTYRLETNNNTVLWAVVRDIRERRDLENEVYRVMVTSEEKERERYAKELHDGLGPLLSTSLIYLQTISNEKNPKLLKDYVERANDLLQDAVKNISEISNNLSPVILRNYGVMEAIRSFIEKLGSLLKTEFIINANTKNRFPELIEFTIYRTLTELINNSIKHAQANKITITLNYLSEELNVNYTDDGVGFNYHEEKRVAKGFGLINLENRIKKIGGTYKYYSTPGDGVNVSVIIKTKSCD